jgi:hypothetical protein
MAITAAADSSADSSRFRSARVFHCIWLDKKQCLTQRSQRGQPQPKTLQPRISPISRMGNGFRIPLIREIREIRGKKSFGNGVNLSYCSTKAAKIFNFEKLSFLFAAFA